MSFVKVAPANSIKPGECKEVEANGQAIALFNIEGKFYAIDAVCPHRGGPLGEGMVDGCIVTCPLHGWQFDVTTGVSPVNPAAKQKCFKAKVEGNDVMVEV